LMANNPDGAMEFLGLSPQEQQQMQTEGNDFVSAEEFEARMMERLDDTLAQRDHVAYEQQADQQAEVEFQDEIVEFATENKDKYPYTAAFPENQAQVYSVCEAHYEQTGEILEVQEATQMVENFVDQQVQEYLQLDIVASKLREMGYIRQAMPSNLSTTVPVMKPRGLTNETYSGAPAQTTMPTREESLARVARLIQGSV